MCNWAVSPALTYLSKGSSLSYWPALVNTTNTCWMPKDGYLLYGKSISRRVQRTIIHEMDRIVNESAVWLQWFESVRTSFDCRDFRLHHSVWSWLPVVIKVRIIRFLSGLYTRSQSASTCSSSNFDQRPFSRWFRCLRLRRAEFWSAKSSSIWSSLLKSKCFFLIFWHRAKLLCICELIHDGWCLSYSLHHPSEWPVKP